MDVSALLLEIYGRIPPLGRKAVVGVDVDRLTERPWSDANPIAWIIWHAARVQDSHVAELLGDDQVWQGDDWAERFGLTPDPTNTGYGHTTEQVATVRPDSPEALVEYLDTVAIRTDQMLVSVKPDDLDKVVDDNWDPPVTMGVRLVSIADDCLQHVGQAAYVRGRLGW